eukprot:3954663-Amphidinium_carterae.1
MSPTTHLPRERLSSPPPQCTRSYRLLWDTSCCPTLESRMLTIPLYAICGCQSIPSAQVGRGYNGAVPYF